MSTSLTPPATDVPACVLLVTGRAECRARFEQGAFQLVLCRDGEEERVDLGFSGSRVLERLLCSPGQVVSRDELLQYAWQDRVVSQGSLNQQIYTLRQILFDSANQIIQTLPRRGYLFNPGFVVDFVSPAPAPEALPADSPPATPALPEPASEPLLPADSLAAHAARQPLRARFGARSLLAGSAAAILLAATTLGLRYWGGSSEPFSQTVGFGALQVLYIEKTERQLERLKQETSRLVTSFAGMTRAPARLIVHSSPGFYEIRCLHDDGQINWLKVHRTQVNAIPNAQLQGCLQ